MIRTSCVHSSVLFLVCELPMATIEFLKHELVQLPAVNPLMELTGALYGGNSLVLGHGGSLSLSFTSRSPSTIRFLMSRSGEALAHWRSEQGQVSRVGRKLNLTIALSANQVEQLFSTDAPFKPVALMQHLRRRHAAAAFAKGFFIVSGYAAPDGTHLEFSCSMPVGRRLVEHALTSLHIGHSFERRGSFEVTYVKARSDIKSLLAAWGAADSLVSLEELEVERGMDNSVNRSVNAEMANLQRETIAVEELRSAFDRVDRSQLSPQTVLIVETRLRYPDLPLSRLSDKMPGKISKSTIEYHIRKVLHHARG